MISFNRLRLLFIHDWMTNGRENITLAAMTFLPFVISYIMWNVKTSIAGMLFVAGILALFIGPYLLASHIMRNMRTKQDATAYAMLPGTNLEKFAVRLVDYGLVPTIVAWVSACMALLFVTAIGVQDWASLKEDILFFAKQSMGLTIEPSAVKVGVTILLFYITKLCLIILGGCYFKRYALVKTWLVGLIAMLLFGATLAGILDEISMSNLWEANMTLTAISVGALVGGYQLFIRRQII